jgi:hypothetical protein
MRERLALARAVLTIDSAPGAGTAVHARIPIADGTPLVNPEAPSG